MVPGLERLERKGPRVIYRLSRRCSPPPLIGRRRARPSYQRAATLYSPPSPLDLRSATSIVARHQPPLSLSLLSSCHLCSIPPGSAAKSDRNRGDPISSAEEMDLIRSLERLPDNIRFVLILFSPRLIGSCVLSYLYLTRDPRIYYTYIGK